ncbi:MAG: DUF4856 domain-containing protein [Pseudobacteriovorax sp.]|nr:DUF4856 domain-containing protein [Pseudobacteriovorax sp.]
MRKINKSLILATSIFGVIACSSSSDDNTPAPSDDNTPAPSDDNTPAPLTAYEEAAQVVSNLPQAAQDALALTPDVYEFSRDGVSTVSYPGQIFRQVLIEDLKTATGKQGRGLYAGSAEDFKAIIDSYVSYSYDNASEVEGVISGASEFLVKAKDFDGNALAITEGTLYQDLQDPGKNLSSKLAGVDNPLLTDGMLGWSLDNLGNAGQNPISLDGDANGKFEPSDYVAILSETFAYGSMNATAFQITNGTNAAQTISLAALTPEGHDIAQLMQKFFHSAVSFSQATGDYLSVDLGDTKGLNADNTEVAKAGVTYTALEHHWDEAFGYFGAARDYLAYTDDQIASKGSIDTNGDGSIALLSEKNFGMSVNAAKRDLGSTTGLNLSEAIMTNFLKGRQLIALKPEGYMDGVKALAKMIAIDWEKVMAANTIHYINKTISEGNEYGTEDYLYTDHSKFWSEMKGFAFAFQFSPYSPMSAEQFSTFHNLIADKAIIPSDAEALATYHESLLAARKLLMETYNFDEADVANW